MQEIKLVCNLDRGTKTSTGVCNKKKPISHPEKKNY